VSDSKTPNSEVAITNELCNACGLCCNGVLFKDVQLQPGDDAAHLRSLGLPIREPRRVPPRTGRSPHSHEVRKTRFPQPCAALCDGNRCRIYAERPARCREFECALFKSVAAGETKPITFTFKG